MASELCESGQRGDVHICVSREGGEQNISRNFVQAGTVTIGDGDSGYSIAGTVVIGDRDSGGAYSWDSAEGLGQQARMLRLCELSWKGCSRKRGRGSGKSGIRGEIGGASERKVNGQILRRARWLWFS